ncbi:MAG: 30S ribosome-binding factor RbfA [Cytophagaceae bacterium]|nr:30S ribosome-binding factor RbfA [Cytophagaceae bacterium]MDW8456042.1 30S ribosome-binding factor RbfA [Cytophagaceae bacterium]
MESTRQQKFARLILKELSDIFTKDTKHMFGSLFITVTQVRMSPDLSVAKVYLSFLGIKDKENALEQIRSQVKAIRKLLGEKIKKQVRIIPELVFYVDDSVDYAARINELLSNIHIPPATDAESQS